MYAALFPCSIFDISQQQGRRRYCQTNGEGSRKYVTFYDPCVDSNTEKSTDSPTSLKGHPRSWAYMTMVSLDTHTHSIPPFPSPPVATSAIAHSRSAPKPNMSTFAAVPEEIIVKILEWCDFKGVLACQLVRTLACPSSVDSRIMISPPCYNVLSRDQSCRALRNIVVGSTSLRYRLALSEHGMCDGTSSLSTAEKLKLLTAHTDAWRSLESACPEKADIMVGWSAPIAISCNVMVFSRDSRQSGNYSGRRDGYAEVVPDPHLDLLVLRVPSALRCVKAAHWMLALPVDVCEVCVDASQDLLIYLLYVIIMSFIIPHLKRY